MPTLESSIEEFLNFDFNDNLTNNHQLPESNDLMNQINDGIGENIDDMNTNSSLSSGSPFDLIDSDSSSCSNNYVNTFSIESSYSFENNLNSGFSTASVSGSSGQVSNITTPQAKFEFVDESQEFKLPVLKSNEVEKVRKRLVKRKTRPAKQQTALDQDTKRQRNTLAARRYRERQQKDFEVLDNRIKQLEKELADSKLETLWWKMKCQN
ncbi:hypothetical protein CLIB1444_22S00584 [[Candida] jaroonii]|uniref:Uncharacterized protein n=1 Tax=[Candida] jaroonii TaxID=467808 RepID=A0ACA9YGD7_9ASCO|nr:hypothetical protein CLIB1444_22S00584 [[Candida] jaroonii]